MECRAANQKTALLPSPASGRGAGGKGGLIRERLQLLSRKVLSGNVNEIALAGMPVLPPLRFGRRVGKALQLAQRLSEMCRVVFGIDDRVPPAIVDDQAGRKLVIAEAATALPMHRLCDAALVHAVDDFLHAWDDVGVAMLAQLDHDPASAHLVCNCSSSAGTSEGIEDEIARRGCQI